MEEFRKPSATRPLPERNARSRQEALLQIRRDIKKMRQRGTPVKIESDNAVAPLNGYGEEEKRRLDNAEEREREQERAFAPVPPVPAPASALSAPSTPATTASSAPSASPATNGWNQGDGRRAEQVVIYEGHLPESIRSRLVPAKGTHFRFRYPSDLDALLESLTNATQTAAYQDTGKKDITLTSTDGRLIGHIHFLHMDSRDIHQPEKYYMKFYLFNFSDSNTLRDTKQRLLQFAQSLTSRQSQPSRQSRQSQPSRPRPRPRLLHSRKHRFRRAKATRRNKTRRTQK